MDFFNRHCRIQQGRHRRDVSRPDVIDCPFSFLISPDLGLSYWSSTTRFASPVSAWHVELTQGNADVVNKAFPLASGVLAVRGQQGERDEQ